jgi:hypothetical protein
MKALPQETIDALRGYRQSQEEIKSVLGELYLQQKSVEERQANLISLNKDVTKNLQEELDKIREEYGDGNIDLDKGLFLPGE